MAVIDSFIKGYQDSQSRNDTLKAKAESLKQLQEEKLRQQQRDAQELLFKKIDFSRQELSTKELWNAADDDPSVLAPHMLIADEAKKYGLAYTPSDPREQLLSADMAKMMTAVSNGDIDVGTAWNGIKSGYNKKFLASSLQGLLDQAKSTGFVGKLEIKPEYKPKLIGSKKPEPPSFVLPKSGDKDIDEVLDIIFKTDGEAGVRNALKGIINVQNPNPSDVEESQRIQQAIARMASKSELSNANSPIAKLSKQVEEQDKQIELYPSLLKKWELDEEHDKNELKKEELSKKKRAYIERVVGPIDDLTPEAFGKLMLLERFDVVEHDKKVEAWNKEDANPFKMSRGELRVYYDKGVELGEINPDTNPFDDWVKSKETEAYEIKTQTSVNKPTYAMIKDASDKLQKIAERYPGTPAGQLAMETKHATEIASLLKMLEQVNPSDNPHAGFIMPKTGMTEYNRATTELSKVKITNDAEYKDALMRLNTDKLLYGQERDELDRAVRWYEAETRRMSASKTSGSSADKFKVHPKIVEMADTFAVQGKQIDARYKAALQADTGGKIRTLLADMHTYMNSKNFFTKDEFGNEVYSTNPLKDTTVVGTLKSKIDAINAEINRVVSGTNKSAGMPVIDAGGNVDTISTLINGAPNPNYRPYGNKPKQTGGGRSQQSGSASGNTRSFKIGKDTAKVRRKQK